MVPSNYISLLILSLCMLGAIILGNSLAAEDIPGLVITLGLFSLFFIRQEVLLFLFVALACSNLSLPHIPPPIDVDHLILCGLVPLTLVTQILRGGIAMIRLDFIWLFVALIIGWVWFVAFKRGWSLHFMGGSQQGGTVYLSWTLNLLAILILRAGRLHPKFWRAAMYCYFLGNLVPALSDAASQVGITALQNFVAGSGTPSADDAADDANGPLVRFSGVSFAACNLYFCLLFFVPLRTVLSVRGLWAWPVILGLLVLTGMGGYRNLIVLMGLFTFVMLAMERMITLPRIMVLVVVAVIGYAGLYEYTPRLPFDIQRCVSFIPGLPVDRWVRDDAQDSMDWRLKLWTEAAQDIPKYAIVGKGFTYSKDELMKLRDLGGDQSTTIFITMHQYHNGPLALLLTLGIPGITLVSLFIICVAIRHLRHARRESADLPAKWRHLHRSLLAYFITLVIAYFVMYGDIYDAIVPIFLTIGFLESAWLSILAANFQRLQEINEKALESPEWPGRAVVNMPLANRAR